ncbi:hypothetical protein Poli38472_002253 [Pythium oligandrum]|uniref:Ribosome biogenesis protein NOP53 n=1 Tax=Pythium oligandrum TaxID=41045 RepID=A0A8K1CJF0_PYTOL|nr:hypothetical protein Poli38472_002253 [Pythium oligandrum]|eukprot:TMW63312.1 hypothetical protein Poli38472_002253 [Pythium oligandrum]
MARKRRLQQRVKEVGAEVEASIRQDAEEQKLQFVASDELFQIDTKGGRLTKKQKLQHKDPVVKSHKFVAEKANKFEVEAVKKLQRQQNETKVAKRTAKAASSAGMLWGSDGTAVDDNKAKQLDEYVAPAVVKKVAQLKRVASTKHKVKKVEVPVPGQSYNPDFETHQDVLAAAVAQELERQAKMKEQLKPLAAGLSEETKQYINSDSDDDDENDDDDDTDVAGLKKKQREKLTQSQRNKRARHKQMEMEHKAKRGEKALVKQINTASHILQKIIKDEKQSEKKQELKKVMAEQKLEEEPLVKVSGKMMKIERPTPVSLTDELTGSLRTLRPKGNPLLDRFDSLHKRNMIEVNNKRARSKGKIKIIEVKK